MPIRRYVEDGVFTPKTLLAMGQALEATAEILDVGRDEAKRRAIAKYLIRLAKEDSLDAAALRRRAVAALGGVEYCDVPAIPQPSNPSRIAGE